MKALESVTEYNGIRQVTKMTKNGMVSRMYEIETGKEVYRSRSFVKTGQTNIELIDIDFWDVTIDGKSAGAEELQALEGGPYKILALMNNRTVQIVSGS